MKVLCVNCGPGGKVGSWRSGSGTQLTHQSRKVKRRQAKDCSSFMDIFVM